MQFSLDPQELVLNHDQRRAAKKLTLGNVFNEGIRRKLPLRCLWMVRGLMRYHGGVRKPILYLGDRRLAEDFAHCSESSILRAKKQLENLELLLVTHTKGGSMRNAEGKVVAAATGYQPHPLLVVDRPKKPKPWKRKPVGPLSARLRELAEKLKADRLQQLVATRAGP